MTDKELKAIDIDGVPFQIAKMTPFDASWVWTRVVTKAVPVVLETLGPGATFADIGKVDLFSAVPLLIERLNQQEFEGVQAICLSVCRKVNDQGIGLPIYDRKGNRFVFDDIDAPALLNLTFASMVYNLAPFFSAKALKGLFQSFTGSLPSNPTT